MVATNVILWQGELVNITKLSSAESVPEGEALLHLKKSVRALGFTAVLWAYSKLELEDGKRQPALCSDEILHVNEISNDVSHNNI